MMKSNYILIAFCLIVILSCSDTPDTYTEEVIDGVKHVKNLAPLWSDDPEINLEFVRKYGDTESENEDLTLYLPSDAAMDNNGNLYILDSGNYLIKKFNPDGEFVMSFGNKGQGPGELGSPREIRIRDNEIMICDLGNSSIHFYDMNGKFLKSILKDRRPSKFLPLSSGNFAIEIFSMPDPEEMKKGNLIHVVDPGGEILRKFGMGKIYDDLQMNITGNQFFWTLDSEGSFYIAFRMQNRIEKYSPGGDIVLSIHSLLNSIETERIEMEQLVNSNGVDRMVMIFNQFNFGLQLDKENRMWISTLSRQATNEELANRSQRGTRFDNKTGKAQEFIIKKGKKPDEHIYKFDIYSEEGVLLGSVQVPEQSDRTTFKIFDDRLFIIDKYENMMVYEYRIIEK